PAEGELAEGADPAAEEGEGFDDPVDEGFDDGTGMEGAEGAADPGPSGPGWVIQLRCHHFHNARGDLIGKEFVRETLIKNLINGTIELPDGKDGNGDPEMMSVPYSELGIGYPVVITKSSVERVQYDPLATDGEQAGRRRRATPAPARRRRPGRPGANQAPAEPEMWDLKRYDFTVQFSWTPKLRSLRQRERE
ncbi:unnamed protein product, partial [Ectocarpus sp. 4 AP-2014]